MESEKNHLKYLLLIGFALLVFSSQAIWVTYSPVITKVSEEINTNVKNIGFLAVTYPILFLILTIPSGILLDKNFKKWLTFGILMTAISSVGRPIYNNWWWILLFQLCGAIGQPFLLNSFVPFSSRIFPEKKTETISILSLVMYLGAVFSLFFGVKIYEIGGTRGLSIPSIITSLIGLAFFLYSNNIIKEDQKDKEKTSKLQIKEDFRYLLRSRDLLIIGAILGLGVATFDNLATWLEPVLKSKGLEEIAGRSIAVSIISGLIAITFLPKRICQNNIRTIYLRTIIPIIAVFFFALRTEASASFVIISLSVSGFFMLPAYPIIMDWIGRFHKQEHLAKATSFVGLISRVIAVILTIAASGFISSQKEYFTFLIAPISLAFIMAIVMPNDRKIINQLQK